MNVKIFDATAKKQGNSPEAWYWKTPKMRMVESRGPFVSKAAAQADADKALSRPSLPK